MAEEDYVFVGDLAGEEIPVEGTLSRVVYRGEGLRVVVFAFDAGQELSEHTSAYPAIVQVLSGKLLLTMGGDVVTMEPGDWAHMAADLPHSLEALEPTVMLLTLLRGPG